MLIVCFVFPFVVLVCLLIFLFASLFIPDQPNDSGDLKEKEIESIFFFLD